MSGYKHLIETDYPEDATPEGPVRGAASQIAAMAAQLAEQVDVLTGRLGPILQMNVTTRAEGLPRAVPIERSPLANELNKHADRLDAVGEALSDLLARIEL